MKSKKKKIIMVEKKVWNREILIKPKEIFSKNKIGMKKKGI